jgi:polyisoprenoid-binding protein YceI
MKNTLSYLAIAGLGSVILAFTPVKKSENLTIKPEASKIEWYAEKVTGAHNGLVQLKKGIITLENNEFTGGEFVVDMRSIKVTDISGPSAAKLEGHLKSEDFFGVENNPEARFLVTGVSKKANGEFNTEIKGNLTIKNVTHPITFPARVDIKNGNFAAYGEMVIDRSKYNVRYGSSSFFDDLGDKAIYDEFTMKISIGAQK